MRNKHECPPKPKSFLALIYKQKNVHYHSETRLLISISKTYTDLQKTF